MIIAALACMAAAFYCWFRWRSCQAQLRDAQQELEDRASQELWTYVLTPQALSYLNGHPRTPDTSDFPTIPDWGES